MKFLVTGDRGFIAGYLIEKLLEEGHTVFGIDNDWKYGPQEKSFDQHPNYIHFIKDAKDEELLAHLLNYFKIDYFIMGAAIIGGISLFHELAYDLISENERISAASFGAAIEAIKFKTPLKKVTVISSSMVYEGTQKWPTPEEEAYIASPPISTYGFQKLACEYFAKGAWEQYELPYTIVRPFNCVGIGEKRAKVDKEIMSGNVKLAMSHVVPDLIQKIHKGQNPLHILGSGDQIRHYTAAPDLAKGIYEATISEKTLGEAYNISTPKGHTVKELAQLIWNKMKPNEEFKGFVHDKPFYYDVQKRIPSIEKAASIGINCNTELSDILDEVIPWVTKMVDIGEI